MSYTFDLYSTYEDYVSFIKSVESSFPSVNISEEVIKEYRRKVSMKFHPDKGGSNEMMQKINGAFDYLLKNKPGETPQSPRPQSSQGEYAQPQAKQQAKDQQEESYKSQWGHKEKKEFKEEDEYCDQDESLSSFYKNNKNKYSKFIAQKKKIWSWAGHNENDDIDDSIKEECDANWCKKKAWEISGRKRKPSQNSEVTFFSYDGRHPNKGLTVFCSNEAMEYFISIYLRWAGTTPKAVIAVRGKATGALQATALVFPIRQGNAVSRRPIYFHLNPFQDSEFLQQVNDYLEYFFNVGE